MPYTRATDREIISTRVFDVPRDLMFKAWTDPDHLKLWWGPKGFTNTFHEFDPRPGGLWTFVMHGPDGTDYKNKSVFVEVVKPERIVFDHIAPKFRATVTFEDMGAKTKMVWRMLFDTAEDFDRVKGFAVEGNNQNLDRLAEHLTKMG